jgi:hypothetical protein
MLVGAQGRTLFARFHEGISTPARDAGRDGGAMMNRLALALPVAAVGLGAVLSSACSFERTAGVSCLVIDGSATVSSPTGTFGPPDFAGANRDYTLTSDCGRGKHDHRDHNLTADAHFTPLNHAAVEHIVGEVNDQPFDLATSWTCSDDPWLGADVTCMQVSWSQNQGSLPAGFDDNPSEPLTASLVSVNTRRDIATRLFVDFFNKEKSNPSACTSQFASVVVAPTANQQFFNNAPVTLNVQRAAGCSPAVDGVQPVFQLQWQKMDNNTGQFSDFSIAPTFDGTANPNGTSISQDIFRQFEGHIGFNRWRVRAKLLNTPQDAPWSDFSQFDLIS